MIHDAHCEVTCDNDGCCEAVRVPLSTVGTGMMHATITCDDSTEAVEDKLPGLGWVVKDGKHFCSLEHAKPQPKRKK